MNTLTFTLRRFLTDQAGATAIEYVLIAALIAVVIIVAVSSVGDGVIGLFDHVSGQTNTAVNEANI